MRNTPTSSPAPWALEGSLFHLRLFMPWPLGGKLVKHYLHLHGLLLKNVFYNVIANTGFIHFQIIFFPSSLWLTWNTSLQIGKDFSNNLCCPIANDLG